MKINLSKIKIKNFKSIKELEMSLLVNSSGLEKDILFGGFKSVLDGKAGLAGYNVIFGRNSIGKSTILEALSFVIDLHMNRISNAAFQKTIEKFLAGNIDPYSPNIIAFSNRRNILTEQIRKQIIEHDGEYFMEYKRILDEMFHNQFLVFAQSQSKPIEISLDFILGNNEEYNLTIEIEKAQVKSNLMNKHKTEKPSEKIINAITLFLQNSFPSSSAFITNNNGLLMRNGYARADSNNITAILNSLMDLRATIGQNKLLKLIQLADPNIQDIVFTEAGDNITFNKIIVGGKSIDILDLSSGTRQFVMMSSLICAAPQANGSIRLIDEFELSLHKELVDVLKILMNRMFEKYNIQYLLTTHSPLAVQDYTSFKQIYSVSIEEGKHVVERLSIKFKPHQNIVNRYLSGDLAPYPDSELSRNVAGDLIE